MIEGSSRFQKHVGEVVVYAVEHLIEIPTNPQTGLPSGTRVHGVIKLTKEVDKSSARLQQALVSGEQFGLATLTSLITDLVMEEVGDRDVYRQQNYYFYITLTNPVLSSIRTWVPNCLAVKTSSLGHMEDITFTYEKCLDMG